MTVDEVGHVSGGNIVWLAIEVVLTAIAIADGVNDFAAGYKAAMND